MAMEFELIRSLTKKPITLVYPYRKRRPYKGFRGRHRINMAKCIGCLRCERDCPAFAIEIEGKGRKVKSIKVHLDRCLFCGQCEENCPRDAIELTEQYELANKEKDELVLEFKKLTSAGA